MDTLRSFKRCGDKGVYRPMSCQGITRQSAVLYRLFIQTIEAPKKRNRIVRETNTSKEKVEKDDMIVSKIEIKLQFPYLVQAQYEHCTAADTTREYRITEKSNSSQVARQTEYRSVYFVI